MNQEQNNTNLNNTNLNNTNLNNTNNVYNNYMAQNSNGMFNNQSLNNQNIINNQVPDSIQGQQNIVGSDVNTVNNNIVSNSYVNGDNNNNNNSQNNKKSNKLFLIILVVIVLVGIGIGAIFLLKGKDKEKNNSVVNEELLANETYKKIYVTEDDVFYFANNEEKVYSFSDYDGLGDYFYRNVNYAKNMNDNYEYDYFLIDINNKNIVEPGTYSYINRISEDYYLVQKDRYYGVIDYKGNVVLEPEYAEARGYEDKDIIFFTATNKTRDEYYLFSSNGSLIVKSSEEFQITDFKVFDSKCKKCVNTILYNEKLYNATNGDVLLENVTGSLYYNFYHEDDVLIVYDEKYKVKEKLEDFEVTSFNLNEDGYPMTDLADKRLYLNDNLELIDIEEEEKEERKKFMKDNGFVEMDNAYYHVLLNGDKYITQVDEATNSIIIYNNKGKKLKTASVGDATSIKEIYSLGNYFVVKYGFYRRPNVLTVDGEFIVKDGWIEFYYDINKILKVIFYNDDFVLIHDNFKLEFSDGIDTFMYENGFLTYDVDNEIATFYDLNGEVINKVEKVFGVLKLVDDHLLYGYNGNQFKVIDTNGKVTFEFEVDSQYNSIYGYGVYHYVPYEHNEDNIGVIETEDGFYTLNGKRVIDKK